MQKTLFDFAANDCVAHHLSIMVSNPTNEVLESGLDALVKLTCEQGIVDRFVANNGLEFVHTLYKSHA